MPPWNKLLDEFQAQGSDQAAIKWLGTSITKCLQEISKLRNDRNVILYASGFLQKSGAPPDRLQITHDDLNAFMTMMYGMNWQAGLTLVLHTPGGVTNAAETIVAYLRSKFTYIEVIVPTYAMSAGTMISLASNAIVMGRQSQLGPIDPQFVGGQRALSAGGVVAQFERAKAEILANPATAHVWYPILQSIGPALLQEAQNALEYGERMVADWLEKYMFAGQLDAHQKAIDIAKHFNAAQNHKSHGRRIDRAEARAQGVIVEDLETSQDLQEHVLTAYHLSTLAFEKGPSTKLFHSNAGKVYVRNFVPPQAQLLGPAVLQQRRTVPPAAPAAKPQAQPAQKK